MDPMQLLHSLFLQRFQYHQRPPAQVAWPLVRSSRCHGSCCRVGRGAQPPGPLHTTALHGNASSPGVEALDLRELHGGCCSLPGQQTPEPPGCHFCTQF